MRISNLKLVEVSKKSIFSWEELHERIPEQFHKTQFMSAMIMLDDLEIKKRVLL